MRKYFFAVPSNISVSNETVVLDKQKTPIVVDCISYGFFQPTVLWYRYVFRCYERLIFTFYLMWLFALVEKLLQSPKTTLLRCINPALHLDNMEQKLHFIL